jgi:hypothetical protein
MRLPINSDVAGNHLRADGADNAAAVITVAADANHCWGVMSLEWSYSDDPTGATLKIEAGGTKIWEVQITKGGPGQFQFKRPKHRGGAKNQELVITLSAGGAGITSDLNAEVV